MWLAGLVFLAYCYCVGRAKLSGACPGFPLLTQAFAGVPLPSMLGDLGISQRVWVFLCCFFIICGGFFCLCWMLCFAVFGWALLDFVGKAREEGRTNLNSEFCFHPRRAERRERSKRRLCCISWEPFLVNLKFNFLLNNIISAN